MDTIDATATGTVDPRDLWSTARLTFLVTIFIGLLSLLVDRFLRDQSVTQQSLPLALVRCAVPIIWAAVAIMVLASRQDGDGGHRSTMSPVDLATWFLLAIVMGVVVARAADATENWIPLAGVIAVFCVITFISLFCVAALASAGFLRDAATGLVLSGLTGWLGLVWADQSVLANVIVRLCGGVVTVLIVLVMSIRRGVRLELGQNQHLSWSPITVAFIPLLLGVVSVPLWLTNAEQIRIVESVETTRLPLFAVAAFLLLTPLSTIAGGTDALRRVVNSRRLTTVSAFVAVCALAVYLIQSPFADRHGLMALSLGSAVISFVVALLLPWVALHLQRREFGFVEVVALCVAIVLPFTVGSSAGAWQSASLVGLIALLVVTTTRHITQARPLLASVRNRPMHAPLDPTHFVTSVVIPSYNPGDEVLTTIRRTRAAFAAEGLVAQIIVVSDGSTDGSAEKLEAIPDLDTHVWMRVNRGKGGAVREGFARATGDVVCFVDADGDIDPGSLPAMARLVASGDSDVVYGSKTHPDSNITMSAARRLVSVSFRLLVRALFRFDVSDTQTGIKAYDRDLVRSALDLATENGFNLDLELFVIARSLGRDTFRDYPVVLERTGTSNVSVGTLFTVFASTLRMFRRCFLTLEYVPVGGERS